MKRVLIGSILWAFASLFRRIELSGAVPADEFRPAYFAYAAIAPMMALALIAFASRLLARPEKEEHAKIQSCVSVLVVASFLTDYLLVIAALLLLYIRHQDRPEASESLPRFPLAESFKSLLRSWLPILGVSMFLGWAELVLFSERFFESGIVQDRLKKPYALALAGFATMGAVKVVWVFLRLSLLGLITSRILKRAQNSRAVLFDIVMGLGLSASLLHLFWQTMSDELRGLEGTTDSQHSAYAILIAVVCFIAVALTPALTRIREASSFDGSHESILAYLAGLVRGDSRKAQVMKSLAIFVVFVSLHGVLYPAVEDYRAKLFDTFAHIAILAGVALLVPLERYLTPKTIILLMIPLTAFGLLSSSRWMQRPDVRLIAFEYSRFCALGASAPWASWASDDVEVGFAKPGGEDPFPRSQSVVTGSQSTHRPPIFIILWDAARHDHTSVSSYKRKTTPNLEKLAKDAFVFEQARSTATATTLGVRNMMTGCYSTRFMMSDNHAPFFVNRLFDRGYHNFYVTVTGNDYNGVSAEAFKRSWKSDDERVNFAFRSYDNKDELKPDEPKTNDLLTYLDDQARSKSSFAGSFYYLHLTGTHTPWHGEKSPIQFGDTAIDNYDEEMATVDQLLGRLTDKLKELGIYEESLIVVTADHGTGLGEHGRLAGFLPYEEQLTIPLVFKTSKSRSGRSNRAVSNMDIVPSILELIGGPTTNLDGVSFADVLMGKERPVQPRALVAFCAFRDSYAVYHPNGRYKLHHHRANGYEALFDLIDDPGETVNLRMTKPEIAAQLRKHLDHFLWKGRDVYGNPYHYREWKLEEKQKNR